MAMNSSIGEQMYSWATDLFPINRSLTGEGVRETLSYLNKLLPDLDIKGVDSGTKVFDWTVPDEWNISEAYIEDEDGKEIVNLKESNLHVLGYSVPVDKVIDFEELNQHLYSLPEQPTAIPYVTSYYKKRWGFCITDKLRKSLDTDKQYHVVIRSELAPGVLNYGELFIQGREDKEILLSTYVCHPSMANNELSGPVLATALARSISENLDNRYSYRVLFLPETIGAITYLSQHYQEMKAKTVAGFVLTCVGDDKTFSFMPSRYGNTRVDRVARHTLAHMVGQFKEYSFSERGSDERQYCSPGIDLPVVSIMRSKYAEYPEYHTSLDDLNFISSTGLGKSFDIMQKVLYSIENDYTYLTTVHCEPQLGKRGLYPTVSTKDIVKVIKVLRDVIAYSDGRNSLLDIAEIINEPVWKLIDQAQVLQKEGLLNVADNHG